MKLFVTFVALLGTSHGFSFPRPSTLSSTIRFQHRSRSSRCPQTLSASVSSNEELLPGIAAIDSVNTEIMEQLENIRDTPYFRLFSVDILASCEYMPQELFECYSESCEIYPIDDEEIPENLREVDYQEQEFDLDGWARWDMPSNDYYNTEEFPEGYTGYDGSMIWEFIHNRICFDGYGFDGDNWKSDFNKAVSGVHSVVSAQVVRGIRDRVVNNEEFSDDEVWRDPQNEFSRRLSSEGENPLAIENLYFVYMLMLSAVGKVKTKFLADIASGRIDGEGAALLQSFLSQPVLNDPSVMVASNTLQSHAIQARETMWEARMRTRELLRIMNCVQCNKCRLHGKLVMMGLSTALQIHLGRTGDGADPNSIDRVELAALLTTLHKVSRSVNFCNEMR